MRSANSLVSTAGSVYRARLNGAIAGANASYVALEKRREITVVDAATGKWRWTRSGWPQNAVVVGTDSLLYVLPSDGRPAKVLRAIDGEEIALPQAAGSVQHAVAAWGDRLLLLVQEPTLTLPLGLRVGGGATVSLYDPFTGKTDWKRTYPNETLFELADDGRLVALTPDGTLSKIDTPTGTPSKLGELPTELLRRQSSVVYLEDGGGSYAIVNVGRGDSSFAGIATLAVNGDVFAFDAADGRLRWRKEVSHRRLICEDFGQMPVLLFIDNEHTAGRPQNMQNVWRVNLLALHKRSGDAVLDESQFLNTTPVFRGFSVEPERRSIRLLGFNTQLRLVAVEKAAAPDPPAEKETSD
jgi:outer membrane protein assembly factor BamB